MLSNKGKFDFWYEMDDLIERFDRQEVKLLPKLHMKKTHQLKSYDHVQTDWKKQQPHGWRNLDKQYKFRSDNSYHRY